MKYKEKDQVLNFYMLHFILKIHGIFFTQADVLNIGDRHFLYFLFLHQAFAQRKWLHGCIICESGFQQ
jgi:hypothetical protein